MPVLAKTLSRICLAAALCTWVSLAQAQDVPEEEKHPEETYTEGAAKGEPIVDLDPYYTDVAYNIPLTQKPVPTIRSDRESVIYRDLVRGSLIPRYMVLQANVYPVPALSAYIKSHSPTTYRRAELGNTGINLLESATVEFQEPWSVSAFFGNVAKLERPNVEAKRANYGYTGYTFSAGNMHLKSNTLIADDWYEFEWTIKGKLDYPGERLSWRFRAGARFHTNKDINDVVYVSLHRSNLNLHYPVLEWLENANYEVRLHFLQHGAEMVRLELIAGRKVPIEGWSFTPTLDIGFVWTSPDEYSGALRRGTGGNTTTLVLRPSIEF